MRARLRTATKESETSGTHREDEGIDGPRELEPGRKPHPQALSPELG